MIGVKLGVELGLFNELAALQGDSRHASEFAKTSRADTALISEHFTGYNPQESANGGFKSRSPAPCIDQSCERGWGGGVCRDSSVSAIF